ncbi:MAG: F0F1 ATP synthase subunit B [Thermodesulfovibrionales bacterium]
MTNGKTIKAAASVSALAVCLWPAALAFASEAAAEHGVDWMGWAWKVINFAILVFVLVKFGGPAFRSFLQKRSEAIEKSIEEARRARELAEKALAEVQERLKHKDREIEEIIAAARASGEREREALIKEGEKMGRRIVEQARANMDFELKRAKEAVKAEAVELAMELAENKLREKLTPEEQRRLLEDALARLEKGGPEVKG